MDASDDRPALVARLDRYVRAVERMQAEHDRFVEIVSHDLRAPLRGLGQLTDWLREDLGEDLPPEAARHLDLLERRVDRARALVDDLLSYARAGRAPAPPEDIELERLVRIVRDLTDVAEGARVVAEGELPTLHSPRVPLQTVLTNLVGNALKHGGPAVTVTVRARPVDGDVVRIEVEDDGPGIPEAHHGRVFDVFQTLAPRDQTEGSGLGLAIAKKIVEGLGGRVGVRSEPGAGACFWFTWPVRIDSTDLVGDETRDLLQQL